MESVPWRGSSGGGTDGDSGEKEGIRPERAGSALLENPTFAEDFGVVVRKLSWVMHFPLAGFLLWA
jgi:hypothetical protein